MKKFFAFALMAGTLVACNNEAETTPSTDSTSVTVDSTTVITVDTAAVPTSDSASGGTMMDTSAAGADTTKK